MRRAELSEDELLTVRARCFELGLPVRVLTDNDGESVIKVGDLQFNELSAAASHVRFIHRIAARTQQ